MNSAILSSTDSVKSSSSRLSNQKSRKIPGLFVSFSAVLAISVALLSCVESPPARDEIPHIKAQLGDLEKFYRGELKKPMDSLLTQRFYAEIGKRGQWEALTVAGASWPFVGFANRSFYYTKKIAEVELRFRYHNPATDADSLVPVKIRLNYERGKWLVENVTAVEPIVY